MKTAAQFAAILVRPEIRAINAYHVAPATGMIKLDAMENPYRLPEPLRAALGRELAEVAINRYPDASGAAVKAALRATLGIDERFALILGNGSDELIDILSVACNVPGATLLAPVPGFVMYEMSARLRGLRFVGVPLTPEFELDEVAMLAAIEQHRPALTYIAYPNNPTANLFDDAVIDRIVATIGHQQGLVVFDEAYQPFSSRTWMQRMAAHEHVLVMRTLSKFGLAGVRLGYLCGAAALVDEIDKTSEVGLYAPDYRRALIDVARGAAPGTLDSIFDDLNAKWAAARAISGLLPCPAGSGRL